MKIKFQIPFLVLAVTLLFSISQSSAQLVSCISGTGRWSNINGPSVCSQASIAKFLIPQALATDKDGNIYIADSGNHSIRKLSKDGMVTTVAGSGNIGNADGIGIAASFNAPQGIAVDKDGNIYVSDTNNHRIRKISANGTVTTFAGNIQGNNNGTGTGASFNNPAGLLLDENAGILYVVDRYNYKIRKISLTGVVTSFVGAGVSGYVDAVGVAAKFNLMSEIAMDASGNIFVPDSYNLVIRKITPDGTVSSFAGSYLGYGYDNGLGSAAKFRLPCGIAIDPQNNLYVSDVSLSHIRKITPQGLVTSFVGWQPGSSSTEQLFDGTKEAANFFAPQGLLFTDGNLYIADTKNDAIRKATPDGVVTTVAGSYRGYGMQDGIGNAASYRLPTGILVNSDGIVFVADATNNQIRKIGLDGMVSVYAGSGIVGKTEGVSDTARFSNPTNIALDANGNMFVVDTDNHKIRKITPAGIVSTFAGSGVAGFADGVGAAAKFHNPSCIAIDQNGNLFVTDVSNNKIRKITPTGEVSTYAGSTSGSDDGTLANAKFSTLACLTFDKNGIMYVTDSYRIRKITIDGTVSTLAGSSSSGNVDGPGTSARFSTLDGIACDAAGNIFVSDQYNYKIRKVTPEGLVSTYAGSGSASSRDGVGTAASINIPAGLTIDKFDNIYVIDRFGSKILKISTSDTPVTTDIFSKPNTRIQPTIYPNPVMNELHVDVVDANCYILNSTGEIIHESQIANGYVDVKMLKPGLYMIKIISDNNYSVQKFIKE